MSKINFLHSKKDYNQFNDIAVTNSRNLANPVSAMSGFVYYFTYYMELIVKKLILEVKKFVADEDGVTAIEYGLLAALIGTVIVGVVTTLGENLVTVFTTIANALV